MTWLVRRYLLMLTRLAFWALVIFSVTSLWRCSQRALTPAPEFAVIDTGSPE